MNAQERLAEEQRWYVNGTTDEVISRGQCGPDFSAGSFWGAAGVRSTTYDFHRWWAAILRPDWKSALVSEASLRQLLRPRVPIAPQSQFFYAQGVLVSPNPADPAAFPSLISYTGATLCS